ncbi:MAG: rod shape-determining protein MreC, partial [Actinobacteria bacterium]|nr:rod shape-determining protein MreC [Actinomycetota bacterium]
MRDTRRTRVVLATLLGVALLLILVSYADSSNPMLRHVRNTAGAVFGGAEHAGGAVGRFFSRSGSDSSSISSLQRQVLRLRAELSQAQVSKAEYAQLRSMLLLAGAAQVKVVAATVIAVGQGNQQAVTLDAGSQNGVQVGQTVLNGQGLVGKVTAVTRTSTTVQLATDPAAVIGVAVAPSGQLGWVNGPGRTAGTNGVMHLQMLSSAAQLKPGDQLVTGPSASGRPYVAGIPVGVITRLVSRNGALTEAADVRPYVSYTGLSVVGIVITPPAHNPRFAAVPPLPHPGPTVTVTVTAPPAARRPGASA